MLPIGTINKNGWTRRTTPGPARAASTPLTVGVSSRKDGPGKAVLAEDSTLESGIGESTAEKNTSNKVAK